MTITIHYASDTLWAAGADYEQSQRLGALGWFFFGRKSAPDLAQKLRAAGVPINTRWLTGNRREIAAQLLGANGIEWTPEARAQVETSAAQQVASRAQDAEIEIALPEGLELRPYQRAGIAFALEAFERGQKGVIIGEEMGLGKTMEAIGTAIALDAQRVVVVCPASLCNNWRREAAKWWPEIANAIHVINGKPVPEGTKLVILNYEKVVGSSAKAKAVRELLLGHEWDLVIFDEAHFLKSEKAQRTKAFFGTWAKGTITAEGLIHRTKRALLLTGTPIQNTVRESLTLLRAIGAIGASGIAANEMKFLFRYCGAEKISIGRGRTAWTFDGATRLDELQSKLRSGWMVRRLKADVATELPPKVRSVVAFTDHGFAHEIDSRAGADFAADASGLASETVDFEELSAYRAELAGVKAPFVVEHVAARLESSGKIIVFGHHRAMLDALSAAFGEQAIRIDGSTPPADRQALVDQFQTDDSIRVAILSTHAAGVGITLTAASLVVFAEADWNPSWCVQAEDRAHRIGQEADRVLVEYLTLAGTLDARVLQTMVGKMDVADRALDRQVEAVIPEDRVEVESEGRSVTTSHRDGSQSETITLTADIVEAAGEALCYLSNRCDGAVEQDGAGFNGRDARSPFVADLVDAARNGGLTDRQAAWALRVLRTYSKTQLAHLAGRLYPAG